MERKRGGQPGNANAKRVQHKRLVLSVTDELLQPYYEKYEKQYGHEPSAKEIKRALLATLEEKRVLHLYVPCAKHDALAVKRLIEAQFGRVQTCYLTDSFTSESPEYSIYYQRLLNPSRAGFEEWEEDDSISDERLMQGMQALRHDPRCVYLQYRVNDSAWYE